MVSADVIANQAISSVNTSRAPKEGCRKTDHSLPDPRGSPNFVAFPRQPGAYKHPLRGVPSRPDLGACNHDGGSEHTRPIDRFFPVPPSQADDSQDLRSMKG